MGLDITAYSRMVPVACDSEYPCEKMGHVQPYINPDFPEHAEGISGCYAPSATRRTRFSAVEHAQEFGFRAGSYSGYNWWRDELCMMAHGIASHSFYMAGSSGAFAELICFSDCEGTIGPKTSKKLAADFADYQDRADARIGDHTMFSEKYENWRAAFELAAIGGFVRFH